MILVYTGDGKGKTSACVGQALRALGRDMRVSFGQFMKRDHQAGEQVMLARLLGPRFLAGGEGFLRHEDERPRHREAALRVLDWAHGQLAGQSTEPLANQSTEPLAGQLTEPLAGHTVGKNPQNSLDLSHLAGTHHSAEMLILDEALYALSAGILSRQEVEALAAAAHAVGAHLVLSGRNAPDWLVDAADLVTSMTEIKHPWRVGIKAAPGIEF